MNTLDIFHYSFFVFLTLSLIGQIVIYVAKYKIMKDDSFDLNAMNRINTDDRLKTISLLKELKDENKKLQSQLIVLSLDIKSMKDEFKLLLSKDDDNEEN